MFHTFSGVSIIKLEQVNAGWAKNKWEEDFTCKEDKHKKFDFMNHGQPSQKVFIHLSIYSFIHSCLISGQWF